MIGSYSNTSQTVPSGGNISFDINDTNTNCSVTHAAGTPIFVLKNPGRYFVTFNGTFAPVTADGGLITISLNRNNVGVPGATASCTAPSSTRINTLTFSKIIQVKPSCCSVDNTTTLSFANVSAAAVFTNVNVSIWRLE